MPVSSMYEKLITQVLEEKKQFLNDISQKIWTNPELGLEEKFAHELLTDFLEKHGFSVTIRYKKLETAFRAEFQSAHYRPDVHPTIAVICEYDALPEVGHACGHNLIAEAGVAAGLALQAVLKNETTVNESDRVEGKIVVMGAPAEENVGGKILLINEGAFSDINFAMMVHPFGHNDLEPVILSSLECQIEFHGKAAHASCGQWEGVNALDAAVAVYQSISTYRQQMKPDWRIHGIIVNGGVRPNIIPDLSVSSYYIRALTQADLVFLKEKLTAVINAAAQGTGCTVRVKWQPCEYLGMTHCSTMSQLFKKFATRDEVIFPENVPSFSGSTDMGNVSIEVPSIHPGFFIGKPCMIHTRDFQHLAGSSGAQKYTLGAAKFMALTCVELFTKKEVRDEVKQEFQQKKKLVME